MHSFPRVLYVFRKRAVDLLFYPACSNEIVYIILLLHTTDNHTFGCRGVDKFVLFEVDTYMVWGLAAFAIGAEEYQIALAEVAFANLVYVGGIDICRTALEALAVDLFDYYVG